MIKFFSNIRKKLISENKSVIRNTNYLKYALGEIVLVVAGILIALQINNWNEAKKVQVYEVKMLTEIRNALNADIEYFDYLANVRMAEVDSFVKVLLNFHFKELPLPDSVAYEVYNINKGYLYQYNAGPYEALKSSGMDKISNDSIRNSLINLYDFYLPRTKLALEYGKSLEEEKQEYYNRLFTRKSFYNEKGELKIWSLKRNDEFWKQKEYEPLLTATADFSAHVILRINDAKNKMEQSIQLINVEIGQQESNSNSYLKNWKK